MLRLVVVQPLPRIVDSTRYERARVHKNLADTREGVARQGEREQARLRGDDQLDLLRKGDPLTTLPMPRADQFAAGPEQVEPVGIAEMPRCRYRLTDKRQPSRGKRLRLLAQRSTRAQTQEERPQRKHR